MSKFSKYLKMLLDANNQSISSLARMAKVERTSIHKALSDERVLAYHAVEKISQALYLSPFERSKLLKYHAMLLQGEETYTARQTIIKLLKLLAETPVSEFTKKKQTLFEKSFEEVKNEQFFRGEIAVGNIVKHLLSTEVFEQEKPEIFLNFSLEDSFLSKYLILLFQQVEKPISLTHIIPFPYRKSHEHSATYGLELLTWILPLCLAGNNHYQPYFYYSHSPAFYYSDPMPYYIITSTALLIISQDRRTAIHCTNPEVLAFYRQAAVSTVAECHALLSYGSSVFDVLDMYIGASSASGFYTMMSQPCLGKYYTRKLVDTYMRKDIPNREALLARAMQRFDKLAEPRSNYYTIFTYEGLRNFLDTGIFCDIPREVVLPVSLEDRIQMVRRLRQDIENGSVTGLIVNPSALPIPSYLTFDINPDSGTYISTNIHYEGKAYYYNIHLIEPIICNSFYDFITALPGSEYVYSKEYTLELIDELLSRAQAPARK